jgi:hypothetical protein
MFHPHAFPLLITLLSLLSALPIFGMINQQNTGSMTSRRTVLLPPSTTVVIPPGTPLLVGQLPCVTLDGNQFANGAPNAVCLFGGSFNLTVIGQSVESPQTTHKINPGDKLYATGTLDTATNVTYGLTIDANSNNTFFGYLDPQSPSIAAGATDTAASVLLDHGM